MSTKIDASFFFDKIYLVISNLISYNLINNGGIIVFKKSKVVLKEEAPSSYKVFIRCSKYICLVLAFAMIFTSINWNAFVVRGSEEIMQLFYNIYIICL